MALDGKVSTLDMSEDLKPFIASVDELREELGSIQLPKQLQISIDKRLEQIRASITNYRYRGVDALEDALIALTGEIVLYSDQFKNSKGQAIITKAGALIKGCRTLVTKSRGYEKDVSWVLEKVEDVTALLGKIPG